MDFHEFLQIKTTSPEKFRVRPSTGILSPGANTIINVVLQQGHEMPVLSKDKFLVMCMELSSDASTTSHDIAELWKNTSSNSIRVEQHRLKCWMTSSIQSSEMAKNGSLYTGPFEGDRQISHFNSTVSKFEVFKIQARIIRIMDEVLPPTLRGEAGGVYMKTRTNWDI